MGRGPGKNNENEQNATTVPNDHSGQIGVSFEDRGFAEKATQAHNAMKEFGETRHNTAYDEALLSPLSRLLYEWTLRAHAQTAQQLGPTATALRHIPPLRAAPRNRCSTTA